MSTSNVLEVITKGRYMYDAPDTISEPTSCRSSTSQSTRTESQLSLEYLPPEAPYYGSLMPYHTPEDSPNTSPVPPMDNTDQPDETTTTRLYEKIQALSEQIHSELGTMQDVESLQSYRPTPIDNHADSNSQMSDRAFSSVTSDDDNLDHSRGSTIVAENDLLDSSLNIRMSSNDCRELVCPPDASNDGHNSPSNSLTTPRTCDTNLSSGSVKSRDPSLYSEAHLDPKLRKALDKMRKLDEKLADLDKKEREVKRQRKLLEQEMESSSVHSTSLQSLDREFYSPVFATQLNDDASTAANKVHSAKSGSTNQGDTEEEGEDGHRPKPWTQDNIKGTNFIKRNIELASDAGALVAMTEAEKDRLEQLLTDDINETDEVLDDGPLRICAADSNDGFVYEEQDLDRMKSIDTQLQAILPAKDWELISCSSRIETTSPPPHQSDTPDLNNEEMTSTIENDGTEMAMGDSGSKQLIEANHIVPGEEVLHQFQMSRTERERLKDIDERLRLIQEENELTMQALLPAPELQSLLDQYSHNTDHTDIHDCWGVDTADDVS